MLEDPSALQNKTESGCTIATTDSAASQQDVPSTFPAALVAIVNRWPDRVAMRRKRFGVWQSYTWHALADRIETISAGLAARGVRRGERIALIGGNRPELYIAIAAAQTLGAIPVPLYPDMSVAELRWAIGHCGARVVFAEDQEQTDKLSASGVTLDLVTHIDERGLTRLQRKDFISFTNLIAEGEKYRTVHGDHLRREAAACRPEDTAVILYTSGTSGRPKGVVMTHRALLASARAVIAAEKLTDQDEVLAFLPIAWSKDHLASYAMAIAGGLVVNCPESRETALTDLREIGPTFVIAPPRFYETLSRSLGRRSEGAGFVQRRLIESFVGAAKRVRGTGGGEPKLADRLALGVGEVMVNGPLRNALGFSRTRVAYATGESIGPDVIEFFRAIGVNLKQAYGLSEAGVIVSAEADGAAPRAGNVGRPIGSLQVRIARDGEIQLKGPTLFSHYHEDLAATEAAFTPDGWLRTGDAGSLEADGTISGIERIPDIGKMADGTPFSPAIIETKLKFMPAIKEAVAFGAGRSSVAVLINIDVPTVAAWAERNNLGAAGLQGSRSPSPGGEADRTVPAGGEP